MGPSHRLLGALAGTVTATLAGQPASMVVLTGLVATATSHGWSSPDVDLTRAWRAMDKMVPAPVDALLKHRRLTHWWGLPVLAWWSLGALPVQAYWLAGALLAGWVSHLVGDVVFGRLPLLPWGGPSVGLGLDTGGFTETGRVTVRGRRHTVLPFGPTRVLITLALVWVLAGTPDPRSAN